MEKEEIYGKVRKCALDKSGSSPLLTSTTFSIQPISSQLTPRPNLQGPSMWENFKPFVPSLVEIREMLSDVGGCMYCYTISKEIK